MCSSSNNSMCPAASLPPRKDPAHLCHVAVFIIKEQHVAPFTPQLPPDGGQVLGVLLGAVAVPTIGGGDQLDAVEFRGEALGWGEEGEGLGVRVWV